MDREQPAKEIESLGPSTTRPRDQLAAADPARPPRARHAGVHSLRDYPTRYLATAYHHARKYTPDETALPPETFPEICPWPLAQVLDADFWPGASSGA
jgi:Domain of unknown function DUF29